MKDTYTEQLKLHREALRDGLEHELDEVAFHKRGVTRYRKSLRMCDRELKKLSQGAK